MADHGRKLALAFYVVELLIGSRERSTRWQRNQTRVSRQQRRMVHLKSIRHANLQRILVLAMAITAAIQSAVPRNRLLWSAPRWVSVEEAWSDCIISPLHTSLSLPPPLLSPPLAPPPPPPPPPPPSPHSSGHFWASIVCNFTGHDWKENFRMSRGTFVYNVASYVLTFSESTQGCGKLFRSKRDWQLLSGAWQLLPSTVLLGICSV